MHAVADPDKVGGGGGCLGGCPGPSPGSTTSMACGINTVTLDSIESSCLFLPKNVQLLASSAGSDAAACFKPASYCPLESLF